jgi:hypothetical protein
MALVAGMCLLAPFYPAPLSRCPHRPSQGDLRSNTKSLSPLMQQPTVTGGGSREADMAGGGASGGSVVLTKRHHAGMDKNEHSGANGMDKNEHSGASRLVRAKEIFVSSGRMKQGRVGARVGFDGIKDLESGQILPFRPCVSWCGSEISFASPVCTWIRVPPRDLITTTASSEKAEFVKLVDASVTMGANLTLAMGDFFWLPLSSKSPAYVLFRK